jgi:hypothetical protein
MIIDQEESPSTNRGTNIARINAAQLNPKGATRCQQLNTMTLPDHTTKYRITGQENRYSTTKHEIMLRGGHRRATNVKMSSNNNSKHYREMTQFIYPEVDAWDDQMYNIYEDSTRSQAMENVMAKNLDARDKEASEISRAASSKHMKSRRKPLSSSTKMMDGVQVTTHNYNVEARPHVHEYHIYAARTAGTDDGTNKWGACTTMERALTAMYDEEEDDHNAMESPDVQYYDADQYEEDNDLPKLDVQPETPDRTPDQFTTSEEDTDYDNIEDFKRKDYERNDAVLEGIKAGNETSKLKMYS